MAHADRKNDALTLLYDPKDYYDVVKDAMAEGYDAVKIDPVFAPLEERPMAEVMATQATRSGAAIGSMI